MTPDEAAARRIIEENGGPCEKPVEHGRDNVFARTTFPYGYPKNWCLDCCRERIRQEEADDIPF